MQLTEHFCPRCRVQLYLGDVQHAGALACGACGGVWLDTASATRVADGLDERLSAVAHRAAEGVVVASPVNGGLLACPICSKGLAVTHVAHVELDVCAEHGTWFDRLELQHVARAFAIRRAYGAAAVAAPTAASHVATTPDAQQRTDEVLETASELGVDVALEAVDVGVAAEGAVVVIEVAGSVLEGAFAIVGGVFEGLG